MLYGKAISELPATATATAVAKGVAKDVLYLNAWWRGNLAVDVAVAVAVVVNSDTAFWYVQQIKHTVLQSILCKSKPNKTANLRNLY